MNCLIRIPALMMTLIIFSAPIFAEEFGGVEFPGGASSFADEVIEYLPSNNVASPYDDPNSALGIPDSDDVALGDEGVLTLKFADNSLTTSGDYSPDLWIFEIGGAVEPTDVYVKQEGGEWIYVGSTAGGVYGIDIDYYIGGGIIEGERYSYVKLIDLLPNQSSYPYEGADIDAVGAISSIESTKKPEIKVNNGYFNLSVTGGYNPPEADCAASNDYGRMVFDEVNQLLYICSPAGWVLK
ncbi:hypothetical protein ThidrDRAFT_1348 [Thiorhodococcus drewsii AZ1]|uniref:Uncharacterized protein n=2 Tax=Thiorhodococcus drewsii TaxID=210408 RepID=G2DYY9_9GAMM|nr:hypothetical protein ThidrDRAFT_1348 [Thiorhodococcus drewsii AZ1]